MTVEQEIKQKGRELGFDAVGITDASPLDHEHAEHFRQWLHRGYAGRMDYMSRNLDKRFNPAQLRRGAKSVVVVALNYKPEGPSAELGRDSAKSEISKPKSDISAFGKVASYAQYEDYHTFIKSLLRELASFVSVRVGRPDRYKICVDTAPLAEKTLATLAGLGFIGRNHLLIHPQLGPQLLLGELVTTLPLQPDEPSRDTCRNCNRCVEACPTGALQPDGFLDARRCISYQTQYGSHDPAAPDTHGWLFGCDECLLACPFQRQAPPRANACFRFHPDRATLDLHDLLAMSAETFEVRFADSPMKRPGLVALQQTARACLGRSA